MKLAKELGRHVNPMMIVFPLGMLGIGPALTFMFFAFGLVLIASWLGDELVKLLGVGVDPLARRSAPSSLRHLREATSVLGGGPTRW